MRRSLYNEFFFASKRAFRTLIPLARDRELVTWENLPYRHAYILPFYFLAYLARRKDTYYMRLCMLPTVVVLAVRGTYAYGNPNSEAYFETWLRGLSCLVVVAKTLDYALTPEGQFKVGETALPSLYDGAVNGTYKHATSRLPPAFADANELICDLRGIGWEYGKDTYITPEHTPSTQDRFLVSHVISGLKNFLIFDLCLSILLQLPGLGTTAGGSMFFHNLPLIQRYVVSTAIMLLVGVFFVAGFGVMESLGVLIGVGVFRQDPQEWPPLLVNPWGADSLHDFWARRWHQMLRRTFFVFGGIPGQRVAGKVGMIIGTFLGSAFFHEAGLHLISRGFDYRVLLFFLLNGMGVVLEWSFYRLTGRKVAGLFGRIWTWIFILGFGQMLIDSWFVRGLAGSRIIPVEISPTQRWFKSFVSSYILPSLQEQGILKQTIDTLVGRLSNGRGT